MNKKKIETELGGVMLNVPKHGWLALAQPFDKLSWVAQEARYIR